MGQKRGYKVGFWNVAELENKDREFWEKLGEWSVMFLSETWLQKKEWERVKKWDPPKGYIWEMQEARKRNKKGRVMREWLWEGGREGKEDRDGKRR